MKTKTITPSGRLFGEISVPGDKSISHRAIMLGSLARGETKVRGLSDSDDSRYTIQAFNSMGISIKTSADMLFIEGKGLRGLKKPKSPLNVGDSGTTMRVMAGILAGQDFEATLTAGASLAKRPMKRIAEPLLLMGVDIKAVDGEYPPLTIHGGAVNAIDYKMPVSSAQVKSAILFAGLYSKNATRVEEKFKSRDHTERMMKYFGADIKIKKTAVILKGDKELKAQDVEIPGDISSAGFFIAGAILLKGSKIRINRVGINPTRSGMLELLVRMGARIKILNKKAGFEPVGDIFVEYGATTGTVIEESIVPSMIDELPIIFVLASLSRGKTVIKGAKELRVKETDRIVSMKENLEKMGGRIDIAGDDIIIEGVEKLKGANLKSYADHRTCMSMAIAALTAEGASTIDDVECVTKSFPGFFDRLEGLRK